MSPEKTFPEKKGLRKKGLSEGLSIKKMQKNLQENLLEKMFRKNVPENGSLENIFSRKKIPGKRSSKALSVKKMQGNLRREFGQFFNLYWLTPLHDSTYIKMWKRASRDLFSGIPQYPIEYFNCCNLFYFKEDFSIYYSSWSKKRYVSKIENTNSI